MSTLSSPQCSTEPCLPSGGNFSRMGCAIPPAVNNPEQPPKTHGSSLRGPSKPMASPGTILQTGNGLGRGAGERVNQSRRCAQALPRSRPSMPGEPSKDERRAAMPGMLGPGLSLGSSPLCLRPKCNKLPNASAPSRKCSARTPGLRPRLARRNSSNRSPDRRHLRRPFRCPPRPPPGPGMFEVPPLARPPHRAVLGSTSEAN